MADLTPYIDAATWNAISPRVAIREFDLADARRDFERWITDQGFSPIGEWHDSAKYSMTEERRYTSAEKRKRSGGNANATFRHDNPRPNGYLKVYGESPARKWRYFPATAPQIQQLTPEEVARLRARDEAERRAAAERAARNAFERAAIHALDVTEWKAAAYILPDLARYERLDTLPPGIAFRYVPPCAPSAYAPPAGIAYLMRKQVKANDKLRIMLTESRRDFRDGSYQTFPAGTLIVPYYDATTFRSATQTLNPYAAPVCFQYIGERDGEPFKRFRKGSTPEHVIHLCRPDTPARGVLALAEGYATAWTFAHLSGIITGSTCDTGNLLKTALALLNSPAFTDALIIAADDDFITAATGARGANAGMTAAQKIRAAAPKSRVKIVRPPFRNKPDLIRERARRLDADPGDNFKPSDWNDFYCLYGEEEARRFSAKIFDAVKIQLAE